MKKITSSWETSRAWMIWLKRQDIHAHSIIYFITRFNKIKKCTTSIFLMWHHYSLVFELISLTLVSYVCGLMQRILYLIFIAPHCNGTMPLVRHFYLQMFPNMGFLNYMHHDYQVWLYLRICSCGHLFYYIVDIIFINLRLFSLTY